MDEKAKETVQEYERRILEERERLVQERDNKFAELLQTVENHEHQNEEISKEMMVAIKNRIIDLHDSVLEVEMNEGIKNIKEDRRLRGLYWFFAFMFRSKHLRNVLLAFIAGIILTLIPTVVYTSTLKKDAPLPFHYTPNATAERKPYYLQILETQGQVDTAKKTGIYLADQLTIGDAMRMTTKGLSVYLKREINTPTYHIKTIPPVLSEKAEFGDYTFLPNTLVTQDPAQIQIITSQVTLDSAKADKNMTYKESLEIGGGIVCLENVPCYAVPKSDVEERMILKPFKSSTIQKEQK